MAYFSLTEERSSTSPDVWPVSRLVSAVLGQPKAEELVRLPKFQRTIVWSDDQRRKLISSIRSGYPIGSLLLYRTTMQESRPVYTLIDGLQRSNAIVDCVQNPTKYFAVVDVERSVVESVAERLNLSSEEIGLLPQRILHWLETRRGFDGTDEFSGYYLLADLAKQYDRADVPSPYPALESFLKEIKNKSDITQIQIPVLVYRGDAADLPDIFQLINSQGTTLSKYQIFAATWVEEQVVINDEAIVNAVRGRYEELEAEGYQVLGVESSELDTSSTFTLFDFLYGLSKTLTKSFPNLLASAEDSSLAFILLTIAVGLRLGRMVELPVSLEQLGWDLNVAAKRLREAVSFVDSCLRPILALKAIGGPAGRFHSDYQIVSLIGKVFQARYELTSLEERATWTSTAAVLRKTIPHYYLYDIVTEQWRGSGDSRIANVIFEDPGYYENPIGKSLWEAALGQLLENQLQRGTKDRQPVDKASLLFLKYVYSRRVSVYENQAITYEVEHLIPIKRLRTTIEQYDGSLTLPMSALGNLALLPRELNRRKGDRTIVEYYDAQVTSGAMDAASATEQVLKVLPFALVSERSALRVPVNQLGEAVPTADWYLEFVKSRFEQLKLLFFEDYGVE